MHCVLYKINIEVSAVATNACSVTQSLKLSNVEPGCFNG